MEGKVPKTKVAFKVRITYTFCDVTSLCPFFFEIRILAVSYAMVAVATPYGLL